MRPEAAEMLPLARLIDLNQTSAKSPHPHPFLQTKEKKRKRKELTIPTSLGVSLNVIARR